MDTEALHGKLSTLAIALDERSRRLVFAAGAKSLGRGGIEMVHRATGMARSTLARGIMELASSPAETPRIRRAGGGRKRIDDKDATLLSDLETLVGPGARGDPETPLRWTCKSVRVLARELGRNGHAVSYPVVARLLAESGYSLQGNRKTKEGSGHPDRNAQFGHINAMVMAQQRKRQPVISVDTKKKELVGDFRNGGREWRPAGMPVKVRVHDFIIPSKGKAIPYGIYDITRNAGWVSVGVDHDTAEFAVSAIRRWWQKMGRAVYPNARSLLITADAGGSNSASSRLWKRELQRFANRTGLAIHVCHLPPGTRKWNKIEHRLFSFITQNWRGQPLTSLAAIVSLIAATKTQEGPRVRAELDKGKYTGGRKISDAEMARVSLHPDSFHGEWNYSILPAQGKRNRAIVN